MKAKEIIAEIERLSNNDPEMEIVVAVHTGTQVYPVAYVSPWGFNNWTGDEIRIECTLPEGMHTVQRKK